MKKIIVATAAALLAVGAQAATYKRWLLHG